MRALLLACLFPTLAVAGPVETFVRQYEDGTLLQGDRGLDHWRALTSDRRIEVTVTRTEEDRVLGSFTESATVAGARRELRGVVEIRHSGGEIVSADWHIFNGSAVCAAAASGQAADLGTTGVALSRGFAEGNPLGAALIPLKAATYVSIRSLPLYQCMTHMQTFGMVGWAAAGWNLGLVIGGPALGAAGALAGLLGTMSVDDAALECAGC